VSSAIESNVASETMQPSLLGHYRIPDKYFLLELERLVEGRETSSLTPHELFGPLDDDFWVWALTAGRRESDLLRNLLPGFPDEKIQLRTNGASGDVALLDAYLTYRLFRKIYGVYGGELASADAILDFGCGWGRVIRFFLKDVEPERLWGVDANDAVITFCRHQTRSWANFKRVDPFPPIEFDDGIFDLIFCYSVFSHLSEDAHRKWLAEFARILKPGGLLIVTTWDRVFIQRCRELRARPLPFYQTDLQPVFLDTDAWLARYDRGEFCYDSSPEAFGEVARWFGEACIPKDYVLDHWSQRFEILDYLADRSVAKQNVVVARR
jgi:SAM-dependent methyltransferase